VLKPSESAPKGTQGYVLKREGVKLPHLTLHDYNSKGGGKGGEGTGPELEPWSESCSTVLLNDPLQNSTSAVKKTQVPGSNTSFNGKANP